MGLEMRGIDHQTGRPAALARKLGEDPVENTQTTPADEAVVDRLVWAVVLRRIAPAQSIADHEHNPTDHTLVIDPRDTMRQGEIRFDPAHLSPRQPKLTEAPPGVTMNQSIQSAAMELMDPEPSRQIHALDSDGRIFKLFELRRVMALPSNTADVNLSSREIRWLQIIFAWGDIPVRLFKRRATATLTVN